MPSMRLVNPLVRSPEVPAPPSDNPDEGGRPPARTLEKPLVVALGGAVLVVSVVLRFWTPSPMWLDEALTVNIAREPLRAIPHLLRDDGAPPLYYVLLHFWMKVFGTGDLGARSLSGVIGVLTLPAAWLAGYRVGTQSWHGADTTPTSASEIAGRDGEGETCGVDDDAARRHVAVRGVLRHRGPDVLPRHPVVGAGHPGLLRGAPQAFGLERRRRSPS